MPKKTKRGGSVVAKSNVESENLSAPRRRSARLSKAKQTVRTFDNDGDDSGESAGPSRRRHRSESDVSDSDVEYKPTAATYSESEEDSAGEVPTKKPRRKKTVYAEADSPIADSPEEPFAIGKLRVDLSESDSSGDETLCERRTSVACGTVTACASQCDGKTAARSEPQRAISGSEKSQTESHKNSSADSAVESDDLRAANSSGEETENFFSKHLEAISSVQKAASRLQENASSSGVEDEKESLQNVILDMLRRNEPGDPGPQAEGPTEKKKKMGGRGKKPVVDTAAEVSERKCGAKRAKRGERDGETLPVETKNAKVRGKKQGEGSKSLSKKASSEEVPEAKVSERPASKKVKSAAVVSRRGTKVQPIASTSKEIGKPKSKTESPDGGTSDDDDDVSDESDWEEVPVEGDGVDLDSYSPSVPEGGVEITLQVPQVFKKRKRDKFDPDNFVRLQINRRRKKVQECMHKVNLLCLLAHGFRINAVLLDETLLATALSLVPAEFHAYGGATTSYLDVDRLTKLYRRFYSHGAGVPSGTNGLADDLTTALENKFTSCVRDYALLFLVVLRCLRKESRLCVSLYPVALKVDDLLKPAPKSKKADGEQKPDEDDVQGAERNDSKKGSKIKVKPKNDANSDEDFQPPKRKSKEASSSKSVKKSAAKKRPSGKAESKEASKNTEGGKEAPKTPAGGRDAIEHWVEVFNTRDSRWIPVDVVHGTVGSVAESTIRDPIRYVLGFDGDNRVKDVTKKYASAWLTTVPKQRVDGGWWEETLEPFRPLDQERDRAEEQQIQGKLQKQPLPCSIGEFKNHPLYALKRHLLKFQAIYPSNAPTLGFVRGEAVYARECVHTLRSRESWLREARMVRVNERPYKIVKARPKYDKFTGQMLTEQPLELFGMWQTEEYMPPIAFGGKVPRNAYGNVELFKPSMLPVGTVHLQVPGLSRIAAKLNIDCAPAVVGFEAHHRGAHPVYDGWIVCEEFRETLLEAWAEEQNNIDKRQNEKREKRIYGNWRKLIRGVLIRERLRAKYLDDG